MPSRLGLALDALAVAQEMQLKNQELFLSERLTVVDFEARTMSMNARSAVGTCRCP